VGLIATERIVVQVSPQDKDAIIAKAKRLDISLTELMRRGAAIYETAEVEEELDLLADRVKTMSDRTAASIDDVLAFVVESNNRIDGINLNNSTRKDF
jgi:hypothetical protein